MSCLLCELSTILVNLRAILVVQKKDDTLFFKLNDVLTAILFFVFRIFYFPVMIWRICVGFKVVAVSLCNYLYSLSLSRCGSRR